MKKFKEYLEEKVDWESYDTPYGGRHGKQFDKKLSWKTEKEKYKKSQKPVSPTKESVNEATDITKYSPSDLKSVFSKFLYMDDSRAGKESGNLKGSDNRILPNDKQLPTALYMTVTGPDKSGSFLYPKGSYHVGFGRVNASGEVVTAFAGTARLVTYELDDAKQYVKKFSNLSLIKKQMDKGNKGMGAWPATYDLTGDFKGQGKGSKIIKIDSMDEIKY